jgi:hypothetical protein
MSDTGPSVINTPDSPIRKVWWWQIDCRYGVKLAEKLKGVA